MCQAVMVHKTPHGEQRFSCKRTGEPFCYYHQKIVDGTSEPDMAHDFPLLRIEFGGVPIWPTLTDYIHSERPA